MIVETLSILTFNNSWIDDKIWSDGKVVWTRPLGVQLVPDKERHPNTPLPTFPGPELNVMTINVMHHIATTYPRVWTYHRVGCYLLRTSFPGEEFNADILLNFFKIGELVTTAMYKRNPRLSDIQRASAELGLRDSFPDDAIRDFYKVRSRDAAHDWLNARPVDRSTALDCKNWAEAMLGLHWWQKGQKVVRLGRREADGRTSIWPELTDGDSPEDWQIPH